MDEVTLVATGLVIFVAFKNVDGLQAAEMANVNGAHVYVLPLAGKIVLLKLMVELFKVPAVVPDQLEVDVRSAKSVMAAPVNPT